ncbi:MAG TPA: hypothetical protein VLS53_02135 [Candidatus Dormibacteraeota bacterium]|nr:hypothetical protein [Candidatus Dormibacteraeota bacterium]
MTSRWDMPAIAIVRDIASDLTSLDAAIEVLKARSPGDPGLATIDHLVKQCVSRQLQLLGQLQG